MAPFEVMISESQERMCAAVRPERWEAVARGLRALGPAGRGHRPRHRRRRHRRGRAAAWTPTAGARRGPRTGAHPGPRPDQRRDRPPADRGAPTHRRDAPAPGAPASVSDHLPERGMDPGAVLLALLGSAEPRVAPRRLRPVRLHGRGGHGRRTGSWRGGPAGQGHDQGARRHDRRQRRVGAFDPWLGAALASPRRRATSRSPAPGRSA